MEATATIKIIVLKNTKICAYPDNTEGYITQTKDNTACKLLLQNNIKKPFHEALHKWRIRTKLSVVHNRENI